MSISLNAGGILLRSAYVALPRVLVGLHEYCRVIRGAVVSVHACRVGIRARWLIGYSRNGLVGSESSAGFREFNLRRCGKVPVLRVSLWM